MMINFDNLPSEDLLQRKSFAKDIALGIITGLESNFDSVAIGLNGPWGSGKSTLLNYVKDEIEKSENKDFLIMEFNPWMFAGRNELQGLFLIELANQLGEKQSKLQKKLKNFAALLLPLKDLSEYAKNINELNVEPISKTGIGLASKGLDMFANAFLKAKPFNRQKEEIDALLIKRKVKIMVMIDDLDRLAPDQITQMFQLIKRNANFKNVVYLIAYDRKVVLDALEKQYSVNAPAYLEKIIQVDYTIPAILSERLEEIFFHNLKICLDHFGIRYPFWEKLRLLWSHNEFKNYFENLRHVHRYVNSLYFRLPRIHDDINLTDFLLIEAIRIFDYQGYESLGKNYFSLLKNSTAKQTDDNTEDIYSTFGNNTTKALVRFLFSRRLNTFPFIEGDDQHRFSDTQFFEKYFALLLPSKDISEKEFRDFLHDAESRKSHLGVIHSSGRLKKLLNKIIAFDSSQGKLEDPSLFSSLLDFLDTIESEFGQFYFETEDALFNISRQFRGYPNGYKILMEEVSKNVGGLSFSRFCVLSSLLKRKPATGEAYERLEKKKLKKMRERYHHYLDGWNNHYLDKPSEYRSFFLFQHFLLEYSTHYPDGYKEKLKVILESDADTVMILQMFVTLDSQNQEPFGVRLELREQVLPGEYFDLFVSKIRTFDVNNIGEKAMKWATYFLSAIDDSSRS